MVSDRAAETPEKVRTAARSVQTTWVYTLGSIVFFVVFIGVVMLMVGLTAFSRSNSVINAAIVVFMLASLLLQIRYCWFLRVGLGGGMPHRAWTLAIVVASGVVWVFGLFSPELWQAAPLPLWFTVILIAGPLAPRARWLVLAAGIALLVGHIVLARAVLLPGADAAAPSDSIALYIFAAMMPFAVLFSLWWWDIVVELDRHRRSAAELAIAKERLRFAADLHDIQGHHLQVIALKAELAERTLEHDTDAAREHLRETRLIASEALQETRSLVSGYRDVGLDDELENAREVLSAAGATCELCIETLPADSGVRRALAFVVREATTNIIRHSSAESVTISAKTHNGCCRLTISNDGVDGAHGDAAPGTGLDGLRARVVEQGGALTTAIDAGRFELTATVPDHSADRTVAHFSRGDPSSDPRGEESPRA